MSLPFRRRGRPRGEGRLALTGDFPATDSESVTEAMRRAEWDGQTYHWRDATGARTPDNVTPIAIKHAGQDTEPLARLRTQPRYKPAPAPPRPPAIRPLPPELPPHQGLPAAQVTAMLGAIRYPATDGTPEDYAAVMRRWSHLTGTESGLESPGAWPRHAIEAMPSREDPPLARAIAGATHRTAAS